MAVDLTEGGPRGQDTWGCPLTRSPAVKENLTLVSFSLLQLNA